MAKETAPKRKRTTVKKSTGVGSTKEMVIENTKNLVDMLSVIEQLNSRIHTLENKIQEQTKLYNVTTNTMNYILACLYVYELYFSEFGGDVLELRQKIEYTYYNAFNRNSRNSKLSTYDENIIKKINDQLRTFQEILNGK